MRPISGVSSPAMARSVVVLPQPEGPRSVNSSPSPTSKLTPSTPPPGRPSKPKYCFLRSSTSSIAAPSAPLAEIFFEQSVRLVAACENQLRREHQLLLSAEPRDDLLERRVGIDLGVGREILRGAHHLLAILRKHEIYEEHGGVRMRRVFGELDRAHRRRDRLQHLRIERCALRLADQGMMRIDEKRELVLALADAIYEGTRAARVIHHALLAQALQIGLALLFAHRFQHCGDE